MSKIKSRPRLIVFECPFIQSCVLPKSRGICKIPECKICSEYITRVNKLKKRTLYWLVRLFYFCFLRGRLFSFHCLRKYLSSSSSIPREVSFFFFFFLFWDCFFDRNWFSQSKNEGVFVIWWIIGFFYINSKTPTNF